MMETVLFDTAGRADIPELIRLRIAYMIEDFGTLSAYDEQCMRDQLPDYFQRKLGRELIAFVARAEGRLVAAAYLLVIEKPANPLLPNGLDGEVLSVYTERAYRRRGICTKLMESLIAYGRENGLCRIDLLATEDGYPFYSRLGFEDRTQKYRDMRMKFV